MPFLNNFWLHLLKKKGTDTLYKLPYNLLFAVLNPAKVLRGPLYSHLVYFDPLTVIGKCIVKNIEFEKEEYAAVARLCKEKKYDFFVDVGANLGLYSLLAASCRLKSYAFEPIESTFDILARNVRSNHYSSLIEMINKGVSSEDGTKSFNISYDNAYSSFIDSDRFSVKSKAVIDCVSIDSFFCEYHGKRVLLKIDVEGAESQVLVGSRNFLKNNRVDVFVEITDPSITNIDPGYVFNLLSEVGYTGYITKNGDFQRVGEFVDGQHNYFFFIEK